MISWYIDSSCIPIPSLRPNRSTSGGAEEFLRLPESVGQGVDLGTGVVEVQRRTGAGGQAVPAVQRTSAVVAGAHRHAVRVQHLAHVVRVDLPAVQALLGERQGSAPVGCLGGAEQPPPLDLPQLLQGVGLL